MFRNTLPKPCFEPRRNFGNALRSHCPPSVLLWTGSIRAALHMTHEGTATGFNDCPVAMDGTTSLDWLVTPVAVVSGKLTSHNYMENHHS